MQQCRKRDNWFTNYQEIPSLGIKGMRKINDRLKYFDREDFKDAAVLDIGSNIGQMSFQAIDWGAKKVLAVEYDKAAHLEALTINEKLKKNINFVLDDVDNPFFWMSIGSFDTSLFLSIIDTKELESRYGILSKVCMKTKKVMYFEGHSIGECHLSKYIRNILDYTDFTEIVYKGNITRRPFIKCTRNILTLDFCINKLREIKYNKIAVIGKALAGKSTIRKQLEKEGDVEGYIIIDDLYIGGARIKTEKLKEIEKFILFDYRALKYVDDIDVVFFVTRDEDLIGQKRSGIGFIRSPGGSFKNLKEIYTVRN